MDKELVTKPFSDYSSFDDCVSKNKDKGDPEAYCATIKQRIEGKEPTRHLLMPLVRKEGKLIATLSDDSIDRDEELMSPGLIKSFSEKGALIALFDHENKMANWAGGFKDTKVITKSVEGVKRSALTAEFVPLESNPNTNWVVKAINEAESKGIPLPGISIGAIPHDFEDVQIGDKAYRMWTEAELCEASLVPYGSNRNAVMAMAKAMKTYKLLHKSGDFKPQIKGGKAMEEDLLKKLSEQLISKLEEQSESFNKSISTLSNEVSAIKKEMEEKKEEPAPEPEPKSEPAPEPKEEKAPSAPKLQKARVIVNDEPDELKKGVTALDLIKKAYPSAEKL